MNWSSESRVQIDPAMFIVAFRLLWERVPKSTPTHKRRGAGAVAASGRPRRRLERSCAARMFR